MFDSFTSADVSRSLVAIIFVGMYLHSLWHSGRREKVLIEMLCEAKSYVVAVNLALRADPPLAPADREIFFKHVDAEAGYAKGDLPAAFVEGQRLEYPPNDQVQKLLKSWGVYRSRPHDIINDMLRQLKRKSNSHTGPNG